METILLESQGQVAWVWLNQPRRLNAINHTTLAELRQTFESLERDEKTAAIVLAGRGLVFCAGFDVSWMASIDTGAGAPQLAEIEAVYDVIEACPKPVITAVQGAAMGGGLLLALVSDFCLVAQEATFGAPEVKIGIFPNLRLIPRLERVVGLRAAKQMVLTGETVSASSAQSMGLVTHVVPGAILYAEAQTLAEDLVILPPTALHTAKAAFAATQRSGYVEWERAHFATCWAQPEREAAMQAFLSARKRRKG